MSINILRMTEALHEYILKVSLRDTPAQKACRDTALTLGRAANMQTAPEQSQFLALLVKMLNAKKVLELGTFLGYTTLCLAQALPEDGRVITCDTNQESIDKAHSFWQNAGVTDKIDVRIGSALNTIENDLLKNHAGTFDLIYIDADKKNYTNYYEHALTLLRVGGVVATDNVLWDGAVIDETVQDKNTNAIREFNNHLTEDERVDISLVPFADGVTLARKR